MTNNEIYLENERKANKLTFIVLVLFLVAGNIMHFFFRNAYLPLQLKLFSWIEITLAAGGIIAFLLPEKIYSVKKYVLMVVLVATIAIYSMLNASAIFIIYLIPLVLCCRYYDKKFLYITGGLTAIMVIAEWIGNAILGLSLDLNVTMLKPGVTYTIVADARGWIEDSLFDQLTLQERLTNNLSVGAFEHIGFLVVYFVALVGITKSGIRMMDKREQMAKEKAAIDSDIRTAAGIQNSMLPDNFEDFGAEKEEEIYAIMTAAKEVGGDLYDFFRLDDERTCFLVGDVSGKGVPASIFMAKAITCIKGFAKMGQSVSEIVRNSNNVLCEKNSECYFVTAWIGILNNKTGIVEYVNAGHNQPLFIKNGGGVRYMDSDIGFPLGLVADGEYELNTMTLEKKDKLLLYTDGVTEAHKKDDELYGEDRLKAFVEQNNKKNCREIIDGIKEELDEYTKDVAQFDDITILALGYNGN